jgi:eukaryotic-like serine/threonine-protein kinase
MRRLGLIAIVLWTLVGCTSTVGGTAVVGPGTASTSGKAHPLTALLLSLGEMKQLLKFDDMGIRDTVTEPDARGIYEPAGCVGAVFSSMADSYDGSGYRNFYEVRLSDLSGGDLPHWVDQSAAAFDNDSAASRFVASQVAQWRRCAGRQLTYAYPRPSDWQDTYRIGETIDSGCVTMISNVITGDKHYTDIRALAAQSNVVIDLQFTGFDLTDEPAVAINRILDRIASRGHSCALWA